MAVLACAGGVGVFFLHRPGSPEHYQDKGRILKALDARGRTVWQYALPTDPIEEHPSQQAATYRRHGIFTDLDGDGKQEFLYSFVVPGVLGIRHAILCFESNGRLRWKFQPGKEVTTNSGLRYSSNWTPAFVGVLQKPRNDGGIVVIASHHMVSRPSQVVVLTTAGKIVAEYWYPGWLVCGLIRDLDGDGREEILLGGVNSSYYKERFEASLLVLDEEYPSGQSAPAEGDRHQIAGFPVVQEAALVLFPKIPYPGPAGATWVLDTITVLGTHIEIRISGQPGPSAIGTHLHYTLDRNLRCVGLARDQSFDQFYAAEMSLRSPLKSLAQHLDNALCALVTPRNRFAPRVGDPVLAPH